MPGPSHRTRSVVDAAQAVAAAQAAGVRLVRFEYCDVSGVARTKTVQVDSLPSKMVEGVGLTRAQMSINLLKVGILGLVVPSLSLAIVALPPLRERLHHRVLLLGASMGNTGYWGLPVALALLPAQAWAAVVVYDLAGSLVTWSMGPVLLQIGRAHV